MDVLHATHALFRSIARILRLRMEYFSIELGRYHFIVGFHPYDGYSGFYSTNFII